MHLPAAGAQAAQEALIRMKSPKGLHTMRTYHKSDRLAARKVLDRLAGLAATTSYESTSSISISPIVPEVSDV